MMIEDLMLELRIWSEAMGWALLSSLPDSVLEKQWTSGRVQDGLRQDLLGWARGDEHVRRWVVKAWHDAHPEVVAAADHAATEGLTPDAARTLNSFAAEHALLALLTDEFDDGRALANKYVNTLEQEAEQQAVQALLARLVADEIKESARRVRVAILGGHPRDESKLAQRLFEDGPFDVRWRTFEKKPGSGIVQRGVVDLLRHSDAAIIVTGMASHMLMRFAKQYAQRCGLRWKCVEKATDTQLKAALGEMFPDLASGLW